MYLDYARIYFTDLDLGRVHLTFWKIMRKQKNLQVICLQEGIAPIQC